MELSLEVSAQAENEFPQTTVWTISENCRTLRVDEFGFEKYGIGMFPQKS